MNFDSRLSQGQLLLAGNVESLTPIMISAAKVKKDLDLTYLVMTDAHPMMRKPTAWSKK